MVDQSKQFWTDRPIDKAETRSGKRISKYPLFNNPLNTRYTSHHLTRGCWTGLSLSAKRCGSDYRDERCLYHEEYRFLQARGDSTLCVL